MENIKDAIQYMQHAADSAPDNILHRRNLGELLRRAGQLESAIASHKIVISMEPQCAENHFLLGLAYNDNHQFELAIHHYHIALSYDQNYGLAWNNLGASLEGIGDKKTAKIAYATAIALNAQHTEALNNLAAIYSEEGRIDEARFYFEAAISANPDFVDAHYNLSLLKTYQPNDPHLHFLENITQKMEHCTTATRIRYYFALGKALDDTKQYARAFKAYAIGNQLQYQQYPWDKTKLQVRVEQLSEVFTSSFLKSAPVNHETRCPIFIVGMPRAGTTLIEQILSSHNSIYGAGEINSLDRVIQEAWHATNLPFDQWITQLRDDEFIALGKAYLDRVWTLAPDKNFIIDKMPGNCFHLGLIYRMLPHAKIIHAIRDPMDSCFSCFTHHFKDTLSFTYDLTALGNYYALYAKVMQHWQRVLPEQFIFNLPYEKLVDNFEALSKQLTDYIGLPWDPSCLYFYKNNRHVKTASLTQVRKPMYKTSVQRWKYFEKELEPLLQMVAPYRNLKGISA